VQLTPSPTIVLLSTVCDSKVGVTAIGGRVPRKVDWTRLEISARRSAHSVDVVMAEPLLNVNNGGKNGLLVGVGDAAVVVVVVVTNTRMKRRTPMLMSPPVSKQLI
jgi:hypothetical protein